MSGGSGAVGLIALLPAAEALFREIENTTPLLKIMAQIAKEILMTMPHATITAAQVFCQTKSGYKG